MARPSYTTIPDSDIDGDSPIKTTDVMQYLRDNAAAGRISVLSYVLTEDSTGTASPAWDTHTDTIPVYIPDANDYTGIQRLISLRIQCKVSSGATGNYRLRDNASGTTGSSVSSTNTSYEEKTVTMAVDSSWAGTTRTVEIQFNRSAGSTAFAQAPARAAGYLEW